MKNEDHSKVSFCVLLPAHAAGGDHVCMLNLLLDFLFTRRSLTGDEGIWITADELRSLRSAAVVLEASQLRSQQLQFIDRIVAAADYHSVQLLHKAVHTLKYKRVREVAAILGRMLVDAYEFCLLNVGEERPVLCPVPLHWIRKFSRGFNQAELLALTVGETRMLETMNLLKRVRWTGSQVGRRRKERMTTVQNAFMIRSVTAKKDIPAHVILVDDILTTGATLDSCAQALKSAGVKRVEGLVIAIV